jgi:hypothetical protein
MSRDIMANGGILPRIYPMRCYCNAVESCTCALVAQLARRAHMHPGMNAWTKEALSETVSVESIRGRYLLACLEIEAIDQGDGYWGDESAWDESAKNAGFSKAGQDEATRA